MNNLRGADRLYAILNAWQPHIHFSGDGLLTNGWPSYRTGLAPMGTQRCDASVADRERCFRCPILKRSAHSNFQTPGRIEATSASRAMASIELAITPGATPIAGSMRVDRSARHIAPSRAIRSGFPTRAQEFTVAQSSEGIICLTT